MLRISPGGMSHIKVTFHILFWLGKLALLPVLWYRRVRHGYAFRRIRLAGPKYAKVDPADYKRLRGYEWLAKAGRNSFYAFRRAPSDKRGKGTLIYMHREVIEVPTGMVTDHINNNGVDNRMANLRAATRAENVRNRKKFSKPSRSKYFVRPQG